MRLYLNVEDCAETLDALVWAGSGNQELILKLLAASDESRHITQDDVIDESGSLEQRVFEALSVRHTPVEIELSRDDVDVLFDAVSRYYADGLRHGELGSGPYQLLDKYGIV